MDQATQVDFPSISRFSKRKLRRHNTSGDIRTSNKNLHGSWVEIKPTISRPKSLNLSAEMFQRSKMVLYSTDSPTRMSYVPTEFVKEKTPNSSNSSVVFQGHSFKSRKTKFGDEPKSCRCFSENENGVPVATPEGLSWRRLHMSRAKLKATATTSELLSGFAMIAMVELQINDETRVPEWLFVIFAVCTTVLVAVHIFALMISTYILPNIDAISKLDVCELVMESPHERMRGFIELAWAFSTILGLFLFLVEVAIICWVKFWDHSFTAAIAATVIVIPVLVIFVLFAVHFYHSLVVYRCDTSASDLQKLEDMKKQLDEITIPV